MKYFTRFIFLIIFVLSNILCQDRLNEIFKIIYDKMKLLPYGSTIYFAKNGKCVQDYSTSLLCLVNQTLYKVEEYNYFFILNISDYNQSYYYELNILNNPYLDGINCIISYIKNSSNLIFLQLLIGEKNQVKLIKEYSWREAYLNAINKNINCQNHLSYSLYCYYFDKNNEIKRIYFIGTSLGDYFFKKYENEETFQYTNSKLDNSYIIISILRNNVKYFICLNSSFGRSFKIYIKKGFPENSFEELSF